jgi:hypothetical protein
VFSLKIVVRRRYGLGGKNSLVTNSVFIAIQLTIHYLIVFSLKIVVRCRYGLGGKNSLVTNSVFIAIQLTIDYLIVFSLKMVVRRGYGLGGKNSRVTNSVRYLCHDSSRWVSIIYCKRWSLIDIHFIFYIYSQTCI